MIGIEPSDFRIVVSGELKGTLYARLQGKRIRFPANRAQWRNKDMLLEHLPDLQTKAAF